MKSNEIAVAELLDLVKRGVALSTGKLADLSGACWEAHVISIDVGSGKRFRSILARDNQEYTGVCFTTPGERYLVMFSPESGKTLVRSYSRKFCWGGIGSGFERSILAEIANILIGGLSGVLADREAMGRILSAPTMIAGKKSAIYAQAFGDLQSRDDIMVDALIHISAPDLGADCTLMLRLDSVTTNFLLTPDPDAVPTVA